MVTYRKHRKQARDLHDHELVRPRVKPRMIAVGAGHHRTPKGACHPMLLFRFPGYRDHLAGGPVETRAQRAGRRKRRSRVARAGEGEIVDRGEGRRVARRKLRLDAAESAGLDVNRARQRKARCLRANGSACRWDQRRTARPSAWPAGCRPPRGAAAAARARPVRTWRRGGPRRAGPGVAWVPR